MHYEGSIRALPMHCFLAQYHRSNKNLKYNLHNALFLKGCILFNDFSFMQTCDWSTNSFLHMTTCKGCILAKIQPPSLSSLITMPHKQNAYDNVLRYKHWECPHTFIADNIASCWL